MRNLEETTGRLGNKLFQWSYIYAQFREGKIPDTYVQDYRYFDKYKEDLRKIFGEGIVSKPYVGIHVRRGDYVGNTFHADLMKTDYYQRAMALFPDRNFKVFSDDITWCKQQEIFKDCFMSTNNNEIDDINELAGCEGIIMANSSFSFWAAYLSTALSHNIVAPKEEIWFNDGVIRTHLPDTWNKI